jgi:hypothetical protein
MIEMHGSQEHASQLTSQMDAQNLPMTWFECKEEQFV